MDSTDSTHRNKETKGVRQNFSLMLWGAVDEWCGQDRSTLIHLAGETWLAERPRLPSLPSRLAHPKAPEKHGTKHGKNMEKHGKTSLWWRKL